MRYINLSKLKLPDGWEDKARKALDEVQALPPNERAKAINKHSPIWAELKDSLAELSHDKCWYCEAIQVRSDKAVDHFRPKNAVAESDGHGGYWWLAFDWHNYRYCCTFCNSRRKDDVTGESGGKQDHFPVEDEAKRARNQGDDITCERPCLLDPTVSLDPGLIWYGEDGMPTCRSTDSWLCKRVDASIWLYNLKHTGLVERRLALISDINSGVKIGKKLYEQYQSGDVDAEGMLNELTVTLRRKMDGDSEFSSVARSTLMGHRNLPWVEELFATM